MAFFKFRVSGAKATGGDNASRPSESVETMRLRARHRLIGAVVLVLVAVIGFPLVFDTKPRPVAVDVDIQIPDRAKSGPLQLPANAAQAVAPAASRPQVPAEAVAVDATPQARPAVAVPPMPASQVAAPASLDPREQLVDANSGKKPAKPIVKSSNDATESVVKPPPAAAKAEPREPVKAEAKAAAKPDNTESARARALLEGKSPLSVASDAAADTGRFIVQVGAFADATKAREVRMKVERAGLTTYTHVAETADGKRIRVRVGPFTNRAQAEKAAAKIRTLDLPAAILTL